MYFVYNIGCAERIGLDWRNVRLSTYAKNVAMNLQSGWANAQAAIIGIH